MKSLQICLLLAFTLLGCTKPQSLEPIPSGPGFASQEKLQEHFQKHGSEFGPVTITVYLAMAQQLRDAKPSSDVLRATRQDGVTSKFQRSTGAFVAFNPNRTIRTFFKPNDGERYFRRQLSR